MKKFVSILLVLVLMMSFSAAAFADGSETPSTANTSVEKVTINKTYVVENTGTTAPAETFNFTITPKSVTDAPTDVTAAPALNGGTGSIAFGAISATTTSSFDIDLSPINNIGVYTYEIKETAGATAGVVYDSTVITMVITAVTNENGSLEKYVAFYKGTDGKLTFDVLALLHQFILYLMVGMVFRKVRSIRKICGTIVGIQVHHDPARLQHAEPFFVCMFCVRQCPCKISGNDHIKFSIRKFRIFRIHHCKTAVCIFFPCQHFSMGDHIRSQVNPRHLMAFLT